MNDNFVETALLSSEQFEFAGNRYTAHKTDLGDFDVIPGEKGGAFFAMQTPHREEPIRFFFVSVVRDGRDSPTGWLFRCSDPHLRHLSAIISND